MKLGNCPLGNHIGTGHVLSRSGHILFWTMAWCPSTSVWQIMNFEPSNGNNSMKLGNCALGVHIGTGYVLSRSGYILFWTMAWCPSTSVWKIMNFEPSNGNILWNLEIVLLGSLSEPVTEYLGMARYCIGPRHDVRSHLCQKTWILSHQTATINETL